jgi:hypothetical protein
MTNDNLTEDLVVDTTVLLRQRKAEVVKILEALQRLFDTKDWQTLKELVFDNAIAKIEKNLQNEAKKIELNTSEIYRLQGKLEGVRRYDFYKLAETYKLELENLTKKLNENA